MDGDNTKRRKRKWERLYDEAVALRVECKKCNHRTFIPAFKEYEFCYWCGNKIINNSKARFMYKMRKIKGVSNEENEKEN